jgi:hypothetical protein
MRMASRIRSSSSTIEEREGLFEGRGREGLVADSFCFAGNRSPIVRVFAGGTCRRMNLDVRAAIWPGRGETQLWCDLRGGGLLAFVFGR